MKGETFKKGKLFMYPVILGGIVIVLAGFITPAREDKQKSKIQLAGNFNNLQLKDSLMRCIKESSVHSRDAEKTLALYDQRTHYKDFHRAHSVRQLLWAEKELLKSTLATWQQSENWEMDSTRIVTNLSKHKVLRARIEKSLFNLK